MRSSVVSPNLEQSAVGRETAAATATTGVVDGSPEKPQGFANLILSLTSPSHQARKTVTFQVEDKTEQPIMPPVNAPVSVIDTHRNPSKPVHRKKTKRIVMDEVRFTDIVDGLPFHKQVKCLMHMFTCLVLFAVDVSYL